MSLSLSLSHARSLTHSAKESLVLYSVLCFLAIKRVQVLYTVSVWALKRKFREPDGHEIIPTDRRCWLETNKNSRIHKKNRTSLELNQNI